MERWQPQSRKRFSLLVLISLALHSPLFIYFHEPTVIPSATSSTTLAVRINTRKTATETEPAPEPTRSEPRHRPEKNRSESVVEQKQIQHNESGTPKSLDETTRKNEQNQPAEPISSPGTNKALVQHRLQLELKNHFYYPRLARRQGYQGMVTLGFKLHQQGRITDIQILSSSGHRILDIAAKDAVNRMAVGWANTLLKDSSMKIKLPIQYILTEG